MRYMRYHEQGLVRRRKIHGREHEYKLSRRGIRRLRYLSFNLVMQLPRPTPDDDDKIRKLKKELIKMEIDDYESLEPSLKEALIEESFPEDEKR
jgi:hypothetical protein